MMIFLAGLIVLFVWCTGFIAGARSASKRRTKDTPVDQHYRRIVSDTGFVWYEVIP